jgi:hypothetical protein
MNETIEIDDTTGKNETIEIDDTTGKNETIEIDDTTGKAGTTGKDVLKIKDIIDRCSSNIDEGRLYYIRQPKNQLFSTIGLIIYVISTIQIMKSN